MHKKDPIECMVHHFKEGAHAVGLQEVNLNVQDLQNELSNVILGAILVGHTNSESHGVVLVVLCSWTYDRCII